MNCACCGSHGSETFTIHDNIKIVRCKFCGLLYADPQPDLDELQVRYSDYELPDQWQRGSDFFNQTMVSIISQITPLDGQILEVGCSYGLILSILQQRGFKVEGVEASSKACRYIKENYNFPIYDGLVENYLEGIKEAEIFDLIIACNVIEHMRDPYTTLNKLNNLLRKGGHVLIVVPDISLPKMVCAARKILGYTNPYYINCPGGGPIAFNCPEHLYFFSRKTLSLLCQRLRWQIIEQKHAPYVTSGENPALFKDLLKPLHYTLARFFDYLGLDAAGISYSQLLLARKS